MRDPQSFFTDPIERELAAETWKVGGNPNTDRFFEWYLPHEILAYAVESPFQKQVITARNWITGMRDQSEPWGSNGIERVKSYFKSMYNRDIPVYNYHIANVEHFFTSALFVAISGMFHVVPEAGIIYYEVFLQPNLVAIGNMSLSKGLDNLKNNWKQLTGPDRQGVVFMLMNSNFSLIDIQHFLNVEPVIVPPSSKPVGKTPLPPPTINSNNTVQVKPGQCISSIANDIYKSRELWVLLWDLNKVQVPNPNRVKPGMVLKWKPINEFTPAQIADAKRRAPTWRNYPM
jgi:hypothetical protein